MRFQRSLEDPRWDRPKILFGYQAVAIGKPNKIQYILGRVLRLFPFGNLFQRLKICNIPRWVCYKILGRVLRLFPSNLWLDLVTFSKG